MSVVVLMILGSWSQALQGLMGIGMAWYGIQMMGSERNAKKLYKYHRYVTQLF
jgi:hypothetical protein